MGAADFSEDYSVCREAEIAIEHGAAAMQDLSEGGIFGALWEMADGAGIGLDVALKRIPIQQETVEICEFFGVNPYQMLSTGGAADCGGGRRGAGAENGTRRDSIGGDWADDIREGEDSPERGRGQVSG